VRKFSLIGLMLFAVLTSLRASAGTTFKATTTLAAETSNNTSAADSFAAQSNGNLGPANISKIPTRTLLYPGATAKIYAHLVPWFGFGDHMNVGYVSSDALQVQKQVNDMLSRGLDGAVIDWYGRGESSRHFASYDQATQAFMHQSELHSGFSFAIMHDAGALKTCAGALGCDVTQTLIDDLNYANVTYSNSPAYLRSAGRPVLYFFGHEAYSIDWTRVRAGVAGNPLFIFRNGSGFTKLESGGAFSWIAPETVGATNLMALNYLDGFYKAALAFPTAYSTGSGYKGFNDTLALWGSNRIIGQQCGQTWLTSIAEAGKYYSAARQLPGIQLVTWNDYEEGSEIESGIDNCVTVSAAVNGTVVSWSITGQINTLDHFRIFVSQDGQNLMPLADSPTTAASLDLAPFGLNSGNYIIFVEAMGKPSLTNKMSAGVQITIPNQPPVAVVSATPSSAYGPVTVSVSAAGSSDPDGVIAGTVINFGDGASAAGVTASHAYSAPGVYTITATVTDNAGASSQASTSVAVKPPQVVISSPAAGASVGSPVHVVARGFSGNPVMAMQIYLDSALVYTINSSSVDTSVNLTAGLHSLLVKGWDNAGRSFFQAMSITAANQPPVPVLSISSGSMLVGGSVTASAAASSDPDGSIAKTSIDFGDGTTAAAINASHQYKVAGTYTVRATVTDNLGASSSASATVTVKPQFVTVTSPSFASTNGTAVRVTGTASSGYPVVATQVYLDGTLKYQSSTNAADTTLPLGVGAHQITVQGWDASGATFKSAVNVTRH
jgi:PKD repeat protein